MSGFPDPSGRHPVGAPRRQALEIGPGGLPAAEVRPSGRDGPVVGRTESVPGDLPALWQNWAMSPPEPDRPPGHQARRTVVKIVGGLAVLGLVIGLALWANASRPLGRTGGAPDVGVGDCLSSGGQRIAGKVDCGSPAADFAVVDRYPGTSDASDCGATPADVAAVLVGPTVLCLDYVAAVGDCLFAGTAATQVGKVACDSTLPGVYRVRAVLRNSINPDDCPVGTTQTFVHRHESDVICLGRA